MGELVKEIQNVTQEVLENKNGQLERSAVLFVCLFFTFLFLQVSLRVLLTEDRIS